jgi:hypothetical protein
MELTEYITKRIEELKEIRAQVIERIVSQNPDVRAIDAAMGELNAALLHEQNSQDDAQQVQRQPG